ncbi:hypothetical protein GJ496_010821 [Pomphorhynchus laevis]|nr:hypothetical protein GJ496_010821 [Pomphorhynchus laevis]
MFDPFNPLDMSMLHSHNDSMKWLLGPPRMNDRPNDKFRITLPVTGYNKNVLLCNKSKALKSIYTNTPLNNVDNDDLKRLEETWYDQLSQNGLRLNDTKGGQIYLRSTLSIDGDFL